MTQFVTKHRRSVGAKHNGGSAARRRLLIAMGLMAIVSGLPPAVAQDDDDVMHTALRSSFSVEADDARQHAARAALWGAYDAFMPTVSWSQEAILNSTIKYSTDLSILSNGLDTVARNEPDLQVIQVSLPLFDGMRRVNTVRAQSNLYEAGKFQNQNVRQTVLLDTATASLAVARNRKVVELRRATLKDLQTIEQRIKIRYGTHDVTLTDVALARSRVELSQVELDRSLSDLETSQIDFTRVSGSSADRAGTLAVPNNQVPATLAELTERLPRQNPQLRAGALEVTAAEYAALAARAEVLPQLNLVALHGWQDNVSAAEKTVRDTTVKLQLRVPIYEPGAFPRILQASAQATQKRYEFLDKQNQLVADARALFLARKATTDQIVRATRRVASIQNVVAGYNIELTAGYRTIVDTLNARAELTDARIALLDLQMTRDKQTFMLTAALALLDPQSAPRETADQSTLDFVARKVTDGLPRF